MTKAANGGRELSSKLTELGDQQSAVLLLRHYHVPRTNHLARLVQPHDLLQAAGSHDNMTRYAFADIIGLDSLTDTMWNQASMKTKFGGFGFMEI